MKQECAIEYLEGLKKGSFLTVNIPLISNMKMPVTVMYIGKDSDGRYNFIDTGKMVMSKSFIEQQAITVDKNYDKEKAMEISHNLKIQHNRKHMKNRER